ncbi:MAG: D-alanyl-D-alanine carboxypeptidase [Elainellaceae cyanobacterium]
MSAVTVMSLKRWVHIGWAQGLASITAIATLTISSAMPPAQAQEAIAPSQQAPSQQAQYQREFCVSDMQTAINGVIQRPTFASASWGVVMESLDSQEKLYSYNENLYFIPASNVKLLTTAAALQTLQFNNGSDWVAFQNWINITNRDSNNGYADSLLRRLGGPDVVRTALTPLGVDPNGFRQVDGSGLSRYNMAKPQTFISILRGMEASPGRDIFYGSLPIAGQSGTLRNRFRNTAAQGQVHAKTGTLNGVRALSGYLEHPRRGTLVFSIMVNQPGQSGTTMLQAIDQMVLSLMAVEDCR